MQVPNDILSYEKHCVNVIIVNTFLQSEFVIRQQTYILLDTVLEIHRNATHMFPAQYLYT